jgi:ribosomal protein L40E
VKRETVADWHTMNPEICPNCGAEVPPKARACPECGSCEETGWKEDADQGGLGLPDEDFDYNDYVEREFGPERLKPRRLSWVWWVAALLLLAAFLGWVL